MSRKHARRFAFTIGEGPAQGLSTGAFRLWTRNNDVYLSGQHSGGVLKLSLHGPKPGRTEAWQFGYTSEHQRSGNAPRWPQDDRITQRFTPTEFIDGRRPLMVIDACRGAFREEPSQDERVAHLGCPDDVEMVARVVILMAAPELSERRLQDAFGEPLWLNDGSQVATKFLLTPKTDEADRVDADATMITPRTTALEEWPEVPRMLLTGICLDWATFRADASP